MSTPAIKSRPVYGALAPDPTGRHHIVVGEGPGVQATERLLADPGFPHQSKDVLVVPDPTSGAALAAPAARGSWRMSSGMRHKRLRRSAPLCTNACRIGWCLLRLCSWTSSR